MEELDPVLDLLEDYYVLGRRRGRGRQPPRYPVPTWNVHHRTLEGIPRTNNSVEGWNHRFNTLVGKAHVNVFQFVEELQEEEKYANAQRILLDEGQRTQEKKKEYMTNDERLRNVCMNFHEYFAEEEEEDDVFLNVWDRGLLKFLRTVGNSARRPWVEA